MVGIISPRPHCPTADLERRFSRSLGNLLTEFSFMVDSARCFMNLSNRPELVFIQRKDNRTIINQRLFNSLFQEAGL
jgi:hypothetical protein